MKVERFVSVGENIHCTRIYKVDGLYVKPDPDGNYTVRYKAGSETRQMPVPDCFRESADWEAGKVRHCAVAIWQANYGDDAGREAGVDYVRSLAAAQEAAGASYLDINVDEFSTDTEERTRIMKWSVETVQAAAGIPVSVDSSNTDVLRAGLSVADAGRGRPMVNSVSLERRDAIEAAREANAVVIASAAGESGLPANTEERIANFNALMPLLQEAGFDAPSIHADPLVLPISVDGSNGNMFLDAVRRARAAYGPDIHIVAGLSNVSFGMPSRKLINQVFTWLAVEAGADGGIVDPMQINPGIVESLDPESEPFQLARALLLGEDDFGMNYITAAREGKLG
jgi:5-methyltetrahydrofolate--homocysteine methyltransferase